MNASEKKIYLTFDDGPVPEVTPWVLQLLKEENITATFFCVGENVARHPEIYRELLQQGHSAGNHTYNHLDGWSTGTENYIDNIKQCAQLVHTKLFRPPYGKIKKSQAKVIADNPQLLNPHSPDTSPQPPIIMWDVLSGDYDINTSPEQCLKNVITHVRNGSIILFHDSVKARERLEYALPRFIAHAKKEGYEFGSLAM